MLNKQFESVRGEWFPSPIKHLERWMPTKSTSSVVLKSVLNKINKINKL